MFIHLHSRLLTLAYIIHMIHQSVIRVQRLPWDYFLLIAQLANHQQEYWIPSSVSCWLISIHLIILLYKKIPVYPMFSTCSEIEIYSDVKVRLLIKTKDEFLLRCSIGSGPSQELQIIESCIHWSEHQGYNTNNSYPSISNWFPYMRRQLIIVIIFSR